MAHERERELLTRKELAAVLEKDWRTISKWQDDGMPVAKRGRGGRPSLFDEAEVRAWLQQREEAAQDAGVPDVNAARARKEHWQACLAEQLHAMRAKTLLPAEEVRKAWTAEYAAIKAILIASYTSSGDRVFRAGTLEGLAGVERELKAIAFEVMREISDPDRDTGEAA